MRTQTPVPKHPNNTLQKKNTSNPVTLPAVPVFQLKEEEQSAKATAREDQSITNKRPAPAKSFEEQKSKNATTAIVENVLFQRKAVDEKGIVQKKENNTGLPDNLKTGMETLSGFSMDDVSVHYNSDKPAQLNALAYAQGTDIHLAPAQEKHLPHEAWHVVQQKQGRVKATTQMKGIAVNDDDALEKEADQMGQKAFRLMPVQKANMPPKIQSDSYSRVIQRKKGKLKGKIISKEIQQKQNAVIKIQFEDGTEKTIIMKVSDAAPFKDGMTVWCNVNLTKKDEVTSIISLELFKDNTTAGPAAKKEKSADALPANVLSKEQQVKLNQLFKKYDLGISAHDYKIPVHLFDDLYRYLQMMLLLHNSTDKELNDANTGEYGLMVIKFQTRLRTDTTFYRKKLTEMDISVVLSLISQSHPAVLPGMKAFEEILTGSVAAMHQKNEGSTFAPPEQLAGPHALSDELLRGQVLIFIHGSSVGGLRGRPKPDKGWIYDITSDIDVAIVDPVRFSWAQTARITTYADNETVELNDDQLKLLDLWSFASHMRLGCKGREVNFSVYRSKESGLEHSGWSLACYVNNSKSGPDARPVIENISRSFSTGPDPFALEHQNKTNILGQGVQILGYSEATLESLSTATTPEYTAHGKSLEEKKINKAPTQGNHLFNEPLKHFIFALECFTDLHSQLKSDAPKKAQIEAVEFINILCDNLKLTIKTFEYLDRGGNKEHISKGYFNEEHNYNAVLYSNASIYFNNCTIFLKESLTEVYADIVGATHFQNIRILFPLWLNSLKQLLNSSIDEEVVEYLTNSKIKKEGSDRDRVDEATKCITTFKIDKLKVIHPFLINLQWLTKETFRREEEEFELKKEETIRQDPGVINLMQIFDLEMVSGNSMNCLLRAILRGYNKENEENVNHLRNLIVSNTGIKADEMIDVSTAAGKEVLRIIGKNFGACTVNVIQVTPLSGHITVVSTFHLGSAGQPIYILHLGAHFSYLKAKKASPLKDDLFKNVQPLVKTISLNKPANAAYPQTNYLLRSMRARAEGRTRAERVPVTEEGSADPYTEVEIFNELLLRITTAFDPFEIQPLIESADDWAEAILRRIPPKDKEAARDHHILIRMARAWLQRPASDKK